MTRVIYWTLVAGAIVCTLVALAMGNWALAIVIAAMGILFLFLPRFPKGRYFLRTLSVAEISRDAQRTEHIRALCEIRDKAVSVPECKKLADDALTGKNYNAIYNEAMHK